MAEPINRMSRIVTHEVSLVRRAANNKKFAVAKSAEEEIMNDQLIEAVASTAAEGEAAFIASLKSKGIVDNKKIAAMVANFRIAKNFFDLVTPEEMEEVQKAAGYKNASKMVKMCDEMKAIAEGMIGDTEEPSAVPNAEKEEVEEEEMKTNKSAPSLRDIVRTVKSEVEADFKEREAAYVKKNASLEELVRELIASNRQDKFVAKAKDEYRFLPASNEEIASTLKSAYAMGDEQGKAIETILGRVNDALSKSPTFKSFGSTGHGAGAGGNDAMSKINALAKQHVQKSADGKISEAQARAFVLKTEEGARLYEQYLEEHPAQRARTHFER